MLLNALVGTVLGFLAGLGVGGGSLLILWLTAVENMPYKEARLLNLLFFLPCAIISIWVRCRKTKPEFKTILPAMIAGSITAAVFSMIHIPTGFLKKLFGGLLLFTGLRELTYRDRKPK